MTSNNPRRVRSMSDSSLSSLGTADCMPLPWEGQITFRSGGAGRARLRGTEEALMRDDTRRIALVFAGMFAAAGLALAQPNPYRTIEGWAKMPEGRTWGATSAVEIDKDGRSIWVAERCGANSCLDSTLPVVLKFDPAGQ